MNNWIKNIGLCLVVCIGIYLISCSGAGSGYSASDSIGQEKSAMLEVNIDLENDTLSDENIHAFEQRAKQKLEDLRDYLEILSDSTIDTVFKQQAIIMARDLFTTKENTITFRLDENQKEPVQKMESFFTSMQNGNYGMLAFEIRNVSVIKKMEPSSDKEYKGTLEFRLIVFNKKGNVIKQQSEFYVQSEIIANKVQKEFGNETKQVWEVFLGNIHQIP